MMNIMKPNAAKLFGALIPMIVASLSMQAYAQSSSQFIGDAAKGEKVFKKCKACHQIGKDAKNSTGPVLNNIVGRAAGTYPGYKYGKGMKAASVKGLVWDAEKISKYITNPKKFIRAYLGQKRAKAKMKFKLKKEDQRKDVVAYLISISNEHKSNTELTDVKARSTVKENAKLPVKMAEPNQICIQNNFPKTLLLTAEAKGGERQIKTLGQSGILCVAANEGGEGTVGIFENEDALEGCSRLARAGKTEVLIQYAAFDNCAWK